MPTDTKTAVSTIVFARYRGGIYVLRVRRQNTKKWEHKIMFGAAEKMWEGENTKQTLYRGLREELRLERKDVVSVGKHWDYKAREESHGLTARFVPVEVPYSILMKLKENINAHPEQFEELRKAEVKRLRRTGSPRELQPHYREDLPRIKNRVKRQRPAWRKR